MLSVVAEAYSNSSSSCDRVVSVDCIASPQNGLNWWRVSKDQVGRCYQSVSGPLIAPGRQARRGASPLTSRRTIK